MDVMSWAVLIIAIAVVVAVVVTVPALLQLKNTLKSAERFMNDMDESLKSLIYDEVKPLVRSVNDTMEEVDGIVKTAREGVEKVDDALEAFRGLGETVRTVNNIVDTKIKGTLIELAAYMTGFRVGVGTLVNIAKAYKKKEVA